MPLDLPANGCLPMGDPRCRSAVGLCYSVCVIDYCARSLQDLMVPPGNRLEALKGDRKGQYSIRVNDRWRICFLWRSGDAYEVEIEDYH